MVDSPRAHLLQMHPVKKAKPCCAANKLSGFQMLYFNQVKLLFLFEINSLIADFS
jgi:hypothetical protein